QAEDGIRDGHVTGVQTCALPICRYPVARWRPTEDQDDRLMARGSIHFQPKRLAGAEIHFDRQPVESTSYGMEVGAEHAIACGERSEERRVGKECGSGWAGDSCKR